MTRSLPALRNYLAGQAAYRSGKYDHAVARFGRAVEFDSTFALAGLGFLLAAEYKDVVLPDRALPALARRARHTPGKLGARDQRLLHYLETQGTATLFDGVALWEQAVGELPDRVEAWYELGDELYHWGERLSIPNAAARSALALDRALAIDSALAPALEHRVMLAVRMRDTAAVRRLGVRYLAAYSGSASSNYLRWNMAAALRDRRELAGMRSRFREYSGGVLYQIVTSAQQLVVRLDDAAAAIAVLEERVAAPGGPPLNANSFDTDIVRRFYLLNRGHARAAASLPEGKTLAQCGPSCLERSFLPILEGRAAVFDALYWDGDTTAAARSVRRIALRLSAPSHTADGRAGSYADLCALEHWKLARLDTGTIRRSLAKLRDRATPVPAWAAADADDNILCAATSRCCSVSTDANPTPRPWRGWTRSRFAVYGRSSSTTRQVHSCWPGRASCWAIPLEPWQRSAVGSTESTCLRSSRQCCAKRVGSRPLWATGRERSRLTDTTSRCARLPIPDWCPRQLGCGTS
jgi:hypothetical protein